MKHLFDDMLGEATRLTQSGNLQAATALIQRTLRGTHARALQEIDADPKRPDSDWLIDAETRIIDDASAPTPAAVPDGLGTAQKSANAEQWLGGSHAHQGRQLDYKLYIPPRAAGQTGQRPLILMLHGCTQSPDDFAIGTRMNVLARDAGVLVLYPEQTQHSNAQKCWNWFKTQHQQTGRGEPELLASLTRRVMADHDVDASRIYVAGLSAGGAMADILGRTYSDLFAAVGVHSGLAAGAAVDLPSALAAMRGGAVAGMLSGAALRPVIVFHGDADATVHHANGAAVVRSACSDQQITAAATVHQGQASSHRFTHTIYRAANSETIVEHWLLHGTGHAWSGGSSAGTYTAPGGVDASREMLRFFLSHRKSLSR